MFEKVERGVFYNASIPIKCNLMRQMIFESTLMINQKPAPPGEVNMSEKLELYLLRGFHHGVSLSFPSLDISEALEKMCKTTN